MRCVGEYMGVEYDICVEGPGMGIGLDTVWPTVSIDPVESEWWCCRGTATRPSGHTEPGGAYPDITVDAPLVVEAGETKSEGCVMDAMGSIAVGW